jgi:hypothetical protein
MDAGRPRRRDRPPKAPQAAPEAAVGRRAQAGDLGAPYHPGVTGPGRSPCQDGDRGVRLTVCRGRTPRSRIANGGDLT